MNHIYSNEYCKIYFTIVELAADKRKEFFTQIEISNILKVSRPTINEFEKKRIIREDILEQYCAILGLGNLVLEISTK